MLAIRLQRTGRSGHAQFRLIVQDSHAHPKGGRVVEYLGSYDPHAKTAQLDSEKIAKYLENGAQPSDRVAKLLKKEGVKLPKWVSIAPDKKREIKNPEKLRRNAPPEPKTEQPADEPQPTQAAEEPAKAEAPEKEVEAIAEAAEKSDDSSTEPAAESAKEAAETAVAEQQADEAEKAA